MTIEDVYAELKARLVGGMMFHDEMANYYDFIGMRGYKRCHEYHFLCESIWMRNLERHFMKYHHMLIKDIPVDDPEVIPSNWFKYTQIDVDASTKQNAVKSGVEKWVKWEKETKEKLHALYDEVEDSVDIMFIEKMLCAVSKELKCAEKKHLELEAVSYNMPYIMTQQCAIHDMYKEKTNKVGKHIR